MDAVYADEEPNLKISQVIFEEILTDIVKRTFYN